jgi:hypothetical protein
MKRRKPQPICKCGHARSKHYEYTFISGKHYDRICTWCWDRCPEFEQDNLRTLKRLSEFKEEKENISKFSL